jgi:hypothetical protein
VISLPRYYLEVVLRVEFPDLVVDDVVLSISLGRVARGVDEFALNAPVRRQ